MAVNSYRFIAMYIIIGMLVSTLTAFAQDTTTNEGFYDLDASARLNEISETSNEIYTDSESLVKANQFVLTSSYGDETALGRNWVEIFSNGFLPTGFIPEEQQENSSQLERSLNLLIIWFRWIILLFAGYELFQMIIRKVT